ncbi:ATP/GTP-binding protein, partial [Streptomyces sp. NPDC002920]
MDGDGTRDVRGTHANPVPRPAGPPQVPPRPEAPPAPAASAVADWLDAPRPEAKPGIWRFGYRLPKADRPTGRLSPVTVVGMLVPLVVALVLWSLWRRGSLPYQFTLLRLFTPDDWWWGGTIASAKTMEGAEARVVYDGVFFAVLVLFMGRLGGWPDALRHFVGRRPQPARALLALLCALAALSVVFPGAFGAGWDALPVVDPLFSLVVLVSGSYELFSSVLFTDTLYAVVTALVVWPFAKVGGWLPYAKERLASRGRPEAAAPVVERPRAQWPELRDAGQYEAAELLTGEVAAGRMNDVDCARVRRAWTVGLPDFRETVLRQGGAAWTHPSGARDLPHRTTRHDLLDGQVRIGRWVASERTPLTHHDAGAALGPEVLGTSLLAVGPSGAGKTRTLVEPLTEALALQALT